MFKMKAIAISYEVIFVKKSEGNSHLHRPVLQPRNIYLPTPPSCVCVV